MGSSFKCFFCLKYYSDVDTLLEHCNAHCVDNFDVILNKYIPKGKRTLQVDISSLKCRICNVPCKDLKEIRTHLETTHNVKFIPSGNGMTEYNMASQNGVFSCHICRNDFLKFSLLNSHMNVHVGKVVCENCGMGFSNQHLLIKHKESHSVSKYKCTFCDSVFFKKSQMKYHVEIEHKGKERVRIQKCPQCELTFKGYYKKIIHLKEVHGFTKTFNCHFCQNNFKTRRALTEHVTKFHTEKFKCNLCCKCFSIESKLRQHMRSHSGERDFVCSICKNAYMHQKTLKKHMKTHSGACQFVCAQCGTGFNGKVELEKHMIWHQENVT